ncbi:MAG: DNA adenine methylase [Victivallales bacterium]|jgi:DNA adenine methylase
MSKKLRSPFPWFGGKGSAKIRNVILRNLPPHEYYVEPFGGGASILLGKTPAKVEVYNDVNRGLVNFFRVIADEELFGKFMAKASKLPVSRELFEESVRVWPGIHDSIEQAVRWYYVARLSFSGCFGKSFAVTVNSHTAGVSQNIASFLSSLDQLPQVHSRMQRVQIECCDWRDCLKMYCGRDWLAYCDPPYVLGCRKAGGYDHELKNQDHEELVKCLIDYDGAVILSGYNSQLYSPLIAAGWNFQEIEVVCNAAGRTRVSGLQGVGMAKSKQARIECLWMNPECQRRLNNNFTVATP